MDAPDPKAWYARLDAYLGAHHARSPLLDAHMLDPLLDWQRRVTGGALISFLEYAASEDAFARYPILAKDPITERIFVCITDASGAVAYHDIVDKHSEKTILLFKDEWRAFLDDPTQDHDEDFTSHYEFWSLWHREIDPHWELPQGEYRQLWVHEEGFVLADEAGRGSRNVWDWDGAKMTLVQQDVTKWVA